MKAEDVSIGERYYIHYGFSTIKARCITKYEQKMIFQFWWPFPHLNKDVIIESDIIAPVQKASGK